jgi:hypothetical protein
MVRYCSNCGRATSDDAFVCPYCGAHIDLSRSPIISQPQIYQKKVNNIGLIIAILIIIFIVVPIVISVFIFFYVTEIVPSNGAEDIPYIKFVSDTYSRTLTVTSVDSYYLVYWYDFEVSGSCNTPNIYDYVEVGDQITNCYGTITIVHLDTNTLIGSWYFGY